MPYRVPFNTTCAVHRGKLRFPTDGQSNPTQMIVALALRLADTLKGHATGVAEVRRNLNLLFSGNTGGGADRLDRLAPIPGIRESLADHTDGGHNTGL